MLDRLDSLDLIIERARHQMTGLLEHAAGRFDGIVVAGASGIVAQHTFDGLRRIAVVPRAIVDNNPGRWGSRDGVRIMGPAEAIALYPNALFVVSVFTHTPFRQQLQELGATKVVSYAALFHRYPDVFLPFFAVQNPADMLAERKAILETGRLWADQQSQVLYDAIVNWFVTLESERVPPPLPAAATYFPNELQRRPDEVFVDCGAFDGDTVEAYVALVGQQYDTVMALEPDPATFERLVQRTRPLARVRPVNAAAGANPGRMSFVASGGLSSHASSAGAQGIGNAGATIDVEVIRLDDLSPRPTYVKMDVEGFERDALMGARRLLASHQTAFAVTLYHRMSDLWQLPLFIHECAPDLKLYLRHYAEDWAETVCYAIPSTRVQPS